MKTKILGLLAIASALTVNALAQTATIPDMTENVEAAQTTIITVLGIVGATAVFFVGLRLYKWVTKK